MNAARDKGEGVQPGVNPNVKTGNGIGAPSFEEFYLRHRDGFNPANKDEEEKLQKARVQAYIEAKRKQKARKEAAEAKARKKAAKAKSKVDRD